MPLEIGKRRWVAGWCKEATGGSVVTTRKVPSTSRVAVHWFIAQTTAIDALGLAIAFEICIVRYHQRSLPLSPVEYGR